jgi:translation initiation factor 5
MVFIVQIFYEEDLVEEEVILEWHKNLDASTQPFAKVKEAVDPFVKWLQEAEEESEEDDDDN